MGKEKYTIFDVACWFLNKESMTHKRLQKLCYYAYAWDLAIRDGLLIKDCEFEAWVHGPVNCDLYSKFKGSALRELKPSSLKDATNIKDVDDIDFLESVWMTYGEFGANALEVMTHNEMPWKNARSGCGMFENCKNVIDNDHIKTFYKSIYNGSEDAS